MLSVLVNMKSKPTIVSAGFEKTWPGAHGRDPFDAWCRMCQCACDLDGLLGSAMGLEWAPSRSTCDSCPSRVIGVLVAQMPIGVLQRTGVLRVCCGHDSMEIVDRYN